MQDEVHDQITVASSQNCCKRGIEAKEAACNKIEKINNKMLQSIEETKIKMKKNTNSCVKVLTNQTIHAIILTALYQ